MKEDEDCPTPARKSSNPVEQKSNLEEHHNEEPTPGVWNTMCISKHLEQKPLLRGECDNMQIAKNRLNIKQIL